MMDIYPVLTGKQIKYLLRNFIDIPDEIKKPFFFKGKFRVIKSNVDLRYIKIKGLKNVLDLSKFYE